MADPTVYFRAMAWNNAWANHRLLEACEALDQAAFEAERTSFFPSIQRTLNHVLIVDRFYVDALEGGTLGHAAFVEDVPCPTLEELAGEQRAVDRRLIAVCDGLGADDLGRAVRLIRPDHVQVERADRILLHLFEHQVHHRGQAHAMLAGTSVAPPQLDEFFPVEDAPLRARDMAALGLSEADLWGPLAAPPAS